MDTNVFISNNEASVDSTGHIQGLTNKTKPKKGYSMTLPDGTKTTTEIIDDLRGTFYDNQGNRLTKVILSKVRYSPKKKFTLFSVKKRLMNGWDIGGDGNKIWLRKNEQKIKFDIKIKTREVIISAMYIN